jgi:hypothetical protein
MIDKEPILLWIKLWPAKFFFHFPCIFIPEKVIFRLGRIRLGEKDGILQGALPPGRLP